VRNRLFLSAILLLCGAAFAAPSFLARVELAGRDIASVAGLGAPVVADVGDFCLVNASDEQLAALDAAGYGISVLDRVGDDIHLFVQAGAAFDRSLLEPHCRILARYSRGFIVAATEDDIPELNRLPVELARISREPMVLSGTDSRLPALPAVDDSTVWQLVNRVNADTVLETIRQLQDFYTRYSTTDSLRHACAWMRNKLIEFGCDSTALDTWDNAYAPNVVGVRLGRVNPRQIYIVDGHIDNTSDHNASGTAAVIEAARVFADIDFDNTVIFIGFTGEEQGLLGSDAWAQAALSRGDSIIGVLNFDMISYGRENRDSFQIIGKPSNPNCAWLMDFYIAQADTFSTLKTVRIMDPTAEYSDHASFWQRGYVAFCGIEDDFTPTYHTTGDTIGTLYFVNCGTNNWPMATEAIKAAVASVAKLAGAHQRTGVEESRPALSARILTVSPSIGRAPVAVSLVSPGAAVEVYDAAGNLVRSLAAASSRADRSSTLTWDGLDSKGARVGAGIYLFRLSGAENDATAKVILTD
jgi:hypothetical protein